MLQQLRIAVGSKTRSERNRLIRRVALGGISLGVIVATFA